MEGERSATGAKRAADEAGLGTPEAPEARRACQEGDIGAQFRSGAESNLVGQHPAPAHAETSPQGSEQGPSATSFVPLSAVPRGARDRGETPISGAPSETVVPETSGGPADGADGRVDGRPTPQEPHTRGRERRPPTQAGSGLTYEPWQAAATEQCQALNGAAALAAAR